MSYGIYIYYRVPAHAADELRPRIVAMQEALRKETGVAGRLLTKADEPLLWMEIYDGVADPQEFRASLDQAVESSGIGSLLTPAARKTEVFRS